MFLSALSIFDPKKLPADSHALSHYGEDAISTLLTHYGTDISAETLQGEETVIHTVTFSTLVVINEQLDCPDYCMIYYWLFQAVTVIVPPIVCEFGNRHRFGNNKLVG